MLFGDPCRFAVEAMVEPGPDYSSVLGSNVMGRMCLRVEGSVLGNLAEPCCVMATLSRHLVTICASSAGLWHPSLAGLTPEGQFDALDRALFSDDVSSPLESMSLCIFLTNVSEAFDPVKGFAIRMPASDRIRLLVRLSESDEITHWDVLQHDFCAAAGSFATWVQTLERELL